MHVQMQMLAEAYQELVEDMPITEEDFPRTYAYMAEYEDGRFDEQPDGLPWT